MSSARPRGPWSRTFEHDEVLSKRFKSLERALQGLSGMAIAATNRDKRQLEAPERIEARLSGLEEKMSTPPTPASP